MAVEHVTITDPSTGSRARILVGFGFNCYQLRMVNQGAEVDVVWSEEDFESGNRRASGSGIPILFPFPGRLPGRSYSWKGRQYELAEGDGRGNAIHGFVLDRPWRLIQQTENRVVGQFQASVDAPRLETSWPADFRITAKYELADNTLRLTLRVTNPDTRELPCGLGTHPYFCIPPGGQRGGECLVRLPVSQQWELVDMLPSGNRSPVEDQQSFQQGFPLGDISFDDVFGGLDFHEGQCTARIEDPRAGRATTLSFNQLFREIVVYTPPHRQALCIEPYSCVPGLWPRQDQDVDSGFRLLAPGQSIEGTIAIAFE